MLCLYSNLVVRNGMLHINESIMKWMLHINEFSGSTKTIKHLNSKFIHVILQNLLMNLKLKMIIKEDVSFVNLLLNFVNFIVVVLDFLNL